MWGKGQVIGHHTKRSDLDGEYRGKALNVFLYLFVAMPRFPAATNLKISQGLRRAD